MTDTKNPSTAELAKNHWLKPYYFSRAAFFRHLGRGGIHRCKSIPAVAGRSSSCVSHLGRCCQPFGCEGQRRAAKEPNPGSQYGSSASSRP